MDDKDKAKELLHRFSSTVPKGLFKRLDDLDRGMHMVMHLLSDRHGTILAGDIAETLNMSTPRVAAALKSLEAKGYVVRSSAPDDRRKTVVSITDAGKAEIERCEDILAELVAYLFDEVGEADLNEFLRISTAINAAIEKLERKEGDGGKASC